LFSQPVDPPNADGRRRATNLSPDASAVTLSSGTVNTLVTGNKAAQGLAMRADGTFLIIDEKPGDIRVAIGC
jgi:hypothetical protein